MTLKLPFSLEEQNRRSYYEPDPTMLPNVDWRPPTASEMPSWADAKRVSIDVETKDLELQEMGPGVRRPGNRVVGVSFAIEDGPDFYLPISHEGGDNCGWDVWGYLREQVKNFRGIIVGNGVDYDLDWFEENGVEILNKPVIDIQPTEVLLDENQFTYNMNSIAQRHGLPGKDETLLREVAALYRIDPKKDLWKLRARYVAQYARVDARRPLQILRRQEIMIEKEEVGKVWELERAVTPITVKMRRLGIRVDFDKLDQIESKAVEIEHEEIAKVKHATGVNLSVEDIWRSNALAVALKAAGYTPEKTAKGADSVDKHFLSECGKIGKWILRAREWNKLRTTFAKQVREYAIHHGDEYRIHCTFHQARANKDDSDEGGKGVRYGRFSCTDPNLQQQPTRNDEFGALWRSVYVADKGCEWVCQDLSQQEPRIGVHYAVLLGLPGAKEFAEEYHKNPALDVHQKLADISGMPRKIVKNFVNGRLYGMGDVKLCKAIGQPTEIKHIRGEPREIPGETGRQMIDQFDKFVPWIRGLVRAAVKAAEEKGYVRTRLGRKCRFEKGPDGKIWRAHKAFNRVGQGDAAEMGKMILVEADKAGIPVQLIVHDEDDYSVPKGDRTQVKLMKEIMTTVVTFKVPMKVDTEIGDNWGELEKVDL